MHRLQGGCAGDLRARARPAAPGTVQGRPAAAAGQRDPGEGAGTAERIPWRVAGRPLAAQRRMRTESADPGVPARSTLRGSGDAAGRDRRMVGRWQPAAARSGLAGKPRRCTARTQVHLPTNVSMHAQEMGFRALNTASLTERMISSPSPVGNPPGCASGSKPLIPGRPLSSIGSMSIPTDLTWSVGTTAATTVVPLWHTLPEWATGRARAPEERCAGSHGGRPASARRSIRHLRVAFHWISRTIPSRLLA